MTPLAVIALRRRIVNEVRGFALTLSAFDEAIESTTVGEITERERATLRGLQALGELVGNQWETGTLARIHRKEG